MGNEKYLKKLQNTELEILKDVVEVIEKNNLTYWLMGGTLLGAARHQGFIPWDDDIDIAMPRKDYEKFLKICEKELDDYVVQTPYNTKNYYLPFSKIRKKNTLFIERATQHIDVFKGIFIDVFPFDNVNNTGFLFKLKTFRVRVLIDTIYYKSKISTNIKNSKYYYVVFFLKFLPLQFLLKHLQNVMKNCSDDNAKYILNFASDVNLKRQLAPKSSFIPVKKLTFEDAEFNVPNQYEQYLTSIYGDFMKLPPINERKTHAPLEISFDTTKNKSN